MRAEWTSYRRSPGHRIRPDLTWMRNDESGRTNLKLPSHDTTNSQRRSDVAIACARTRYVSSPVFSRGAKNSKSYVGSANVLIAKCKPARVQESGRQELVGRCYWRRCSRKRRQLTRRWICLLTARSPSLLENPLQLVHKYISTYTRRIDRRCRRCPTSSGNSRELANNHNVESNVVLSLFLSLSLSI